MSTHSKLSPSSAKRWTACPGSVAAEAAYPDKQGEAAALGTHAHAALEHCLQHSVTEDWNWDHTSECDPMTMIDGWFVDRDLDAETAAHVKVAWDLVKDECTRFPETQVFIETLVDPQTMIGRDDMSGTADIILWNPVTKVLKVIDYKNGTGWVDAEGNLQMIIYTIGALVWITPNEWPQHMEMIIVQPRAGGEAVRRAQISNSELSDKAQWLRQCADATDDPAAVRIPSDDACQWCRAKGDCPARAAAGIQKAREVFQPIMLGNDIDKGFDMARVEGLDPETVRLILTAKPFITTIFADIEEHAYNELKAGRPVPGFKLIAGRNARKWMLEGEELITRLKNTSTTNKKKLTQEDYLNMAVVTPAAAEKKIKPLVSERTWKNLSELIETKPGKPQLAPEGHSKPAINVKPEDVFKVIPQTPDFLF